MLISHNLQDVFAVADRVTVLRQGRTVADLGVADTTPDAIVRAITGGGLRRRSA